MVFVIRIQFYHWWLWNCSLLLFPISNDVFPHYVDIREFAKIDFFCDNCFCSSRTPEINVTLFSTEKSDLMWFNTYCLAKKCIFLLGETNSMIQFSITVLSIFVWWLLFCCLSTASSKFCRIFRRKKWKKVRHGKKVPLYFHGSRFPGLESSLLLPRKKLLQPLICLRCPFI